ncbi:FecR family protein [Arachidicoccus terrestris]|uniref:FecR family protein n=1 Tax=Arachidicoccus terrestris TaxID=2875539 RepID=UPI001CC5EDDF|nr:FecR domain-containing protein [Arachidicoccus terrestris]UAY55398.1 FecR domain-containing protein [Arachidicoccus terrestris]
MNVNDHHIDWEKLLDILEHNESDPESLSKEEQDMLSMAKEMRAELIKAKFPSDIGWQRFTQALAHRRSKTKYMGRWLAAASVLVMAGLGVWWLMSQHKETDQSRVVQRKDIMLRRSNGTVFSLGDKDQTIQGTGAKILSGATTAVYQSGATTSQATVVSDTLVVPRGKTYTIQLQDGTKVALNAASTIVFPETFTGKFREVYVQGEAFFDIRHDPKHPFIVHSGPVTMKVLGTAFNVNTFGDTQTTTLVRGKVQVTEGDQSVVLSPGEQSVYSKGGDLSRHEVDVRLYTAWYQGDLFFDDASLTDIVRILGRVYDYDFKFSDPSLKDIRLTLDMRKPASIREVLQLIRKTGTDIDFKINDKEVIINKPQ